MFSMTALTPSCLPAAKPGVSPRFAGRRPQPASGDSVRFSGDDAGRGALKPVIQGRPELITPRTLAHDLRQAQRVKAHLAPAVRAGNLSGWHFACLIEARDNETGRPLEIFATNVELARDLLNCDLRNGMTQLVQANQYRPFTVTNVYLANNTESGVSDPVPCTDCLDLISRAYFTPETRVIRCTETVDAEGGGTPRPVLTAHQVKDYLPLHPFGETVSYRSERRLDRLPMRISGQAEATMAENGIRPDELSWLVRQAKRAWRQNRLAEITQRPVGASAWFRDGDRTLVSTGDKMDWSRARSEDAMLDAVQGGLRKLAAEREESGSRRQPPTLLGVAYYGGAPQIASLGKLVRYRTRPETLVVTVENDVVQVRTIADYLPIRYKDKFKR